MTRDPLLPPEITELVTPLTDREVEQLLSTGRGQGGAQRSDTADAHHDKNLT